jgi:hypothetical protein
MPHASQLIECEGPESPHAFDLIPLVARNGALDVRCSVCRGHGQWNVEIDLVSFRCRRAICPQRLGAGWVETGDDPIGHPDIVMNADGYPEWVTIYEPTDPASQATSSRGPLATAAFANAVSLL